MTIWNNYLYQTEIYNEIFHIPFLLNIFTFIIFSNTFSEKSDHIEIVLDVFSFSTFILSLLYLLGIGVEYFDGRASVFSLNSNMVGIHAAISILIGLKKFFEKKNSIYNIVSLPIFSLLLFGTVSRTAFVILFVCTFLLIFLSGPLKSSRKFYSIILILFAGPVIAYYLLDSFIGERFYSTIVNGDLSARDLIWQKIFSVVKDDLAFGVGQNGYFALTEVFSFAEDGGISPHNVFIEVLMYSGILGLISFIYFIFKNFKISLFVIKKSKNVLPLSFAIMLLVLSLSGQILEQKLPWIMMSYIFINNEIIKKNAA